MPEALSFLYRTQEDFDALALEMRRCLLGVKKFPFLCSDGTWQETLGDNYWAIHMLGTHAPLPGATCEYRGCDRSATVRAWLNIWGTLCEFDACHEHRRERHGKWADSF